jgi:hypothetical protein
MAKLAETMTPEELLAEIRTGALKADLIKQRKTSDEELAMMLLPMYREGRMTKEEFNRFFQGESVVEPPPGAAKTPPTEKALEASDGQGGAASSIFRIFSRGSAAKTKPVADQESQVVSPAAPPPPPAAPAPPKEEPEAPAPKEEAAAPEPPVFEKVPEPVAQTVELKREPEEPKKAPPATGGPPKKPSLVVPRSLLEQLLGRLDSIDDRLAKIEKRLGM